jgi:hypothetical protein
MRRSKILSPAVPVKSGEISRDERISLHKNAVDEYRFQVQLNWNRSQYLLTFNAALLTAAVGLLKIADSTGKYLTAGIFSVGALSATLSIFATRVQHEYYRRTRDRMIRLERELGFSNWGIDTTQGMLGATPRRLGKVTNILYSIFLLIAVLNLAGIFTAIRTNDAVPTKIEKPAGNPSSTSRSGK